MPDFWACVRVPPAGRRQRRPADRHRRFPAGAAAAARARADPGILRRPSSRCTTGSSRRRARRSRGDELAALADEDARENYAIWLRFRDRLTAAPSLEAAYVALFRDGVDVPPTFVHQLTQILLRHILGADADPLHARAAEMLFRPQKIAVLEDGAVMAADQTVGRALLDGGQLRQPGRAAARRTRRRCAPSTSTSSTPTTRTATGTATSVSILRSASTGAVPRSTAFAASSSAGSRTSSASRSRSSRSARSTTSAGSGTSASTPRRRRC